MKKIIYFIFFLYLTPCFSQKKIFLKDLNTDLLIKINEKGIKKFHKSDLYNKKNKNLYVYPEFTVSVKNRFDSIDFTSLESILSNLYFDPQKKAKLPVDISWSLINQKDSVVFTSDHKRFYKYYLNDNQQFFGDSYKITIQKLGLENIKFSFMLYNFDGFITFYVSKDNNIMIIDERKIKWMTLQEFDSALKRHEYDYTQF